MHLITKFIQRSYNMITFTDCSIASELNPPPCLCARCMTPGKSHRLSLEKFGEKRIKGPIFL